MVGTAYQLTFDGETLRFTPPDRLGWEVHVSKIVVIGESTYFDALHGIEPTCCIVDRRGTCLAVPMNTPGFQTTMAAVGLAMKSNLKFTFVKAKGYMSRVVSPHTHRDQSLFEFECQPARGLIGRLFRAPAVEKRLTNAVQGLVERTAAKTKAVRTASR